MLFYALDKGKSDTVSTFTKKILYKLCLAWKVKTYCLQFSSGGKNILVVFLKYILQAQVFSQNVGIIAKTEPLL